MHPFSIQITKKYVNLVFILILLLNTSLIYAQRSFVHPGLSHKQSDFDRMKSMVDAKIDPWYTSFQNLSLDTKARYTYAVQGKSTFTNVTQDGANYSAFSSDIKAAYLNAIMWAVSGDTRHADKAVEILNAWQNLTSFTAGGTPSLDAGRVAWQIIEAAEIIRSYKGWAAEDILKFQNMLVYPGYSNTTVPTGATTFYWKVYMGDSGRHGNQDLFGWRTVMAMGVFLDNEIMYDRALNYINGKAHRSDDLPYQSGPPIISSTVDNSRLNDYYDYFGSPSGFRSDIPDYGYNGVLEYFIWENGQCQESSRDQDHAVLGIGMVASIAEMAWTQGDDLYSQHENRILKGYEFATKYNVSLNYSFPDQTTPWEPTVESGEFIQQKDRTGRWFSKKVNPYNESIFETQVLTRGNFKSDKRPIYEMSVAHYNVREGLSMDEMTWTKRALDISNKEMGYEKTGWSLDHLGWGGLTFHRNNWMAGDPVSFATGQKVFGMHKVPCVINAADYDFHAGDGQGKTFNDLTSTNESGSYRNDGAVDIVQDDQSFVVDKMENGEWMSYTLGLSTNGDYVISVRHKTTQAGSKLKFVIDNDLTFESELPITSDYEETVLGKIRLTVGAKVLRVYVTGQSHLTRLSKIGISLDPSVAKDITLQVAISASNKAELKWNYWNMFPQNVSVYRGTTANFESAVVLAENLTTNSYTDASIVGTTPQYYYWIRDNNNAQITLSNAQTVKWGQFFDTFSATETPVWNVSSGVGELKDNYLNIDYNASSTAVIVRTGGITLHAGNYPIVALKADLPQATTLALHNASTSILGGGVDKYSGIVENNIYYYDLNKLGFVRSGVTTMVPSDNILSSVSFSIRLATSGNVSSKLYWVASFESIEKLNQFLSTGIEQPSKPTLSYTTVNHQLKIFGINEPALIRIVDVSGQTILQKTFNSSSPVIDIPKKGIYILQINSNSTTVNHKIIVN